MREEGGEGMTEERGGQVGSGGEVEGVEVGREVVSVVEAVDVVEEGVGEEGVAPAVVSGEG